MFDFVLSRVGVATWYSNNMAEKPRSLSVFFGLSARQAHTQEVEGGWESKTRMATGAKAGLWVYNLCMDRARHPAGWPLRRMLIGAGLMLP